MKAKLVEYEWRVDSSMDPYGRSGEEERAVGAILIPGVPDVLIFMHNGSPVYHELSPDHPGRPLAEFSIERREREFKVAGSIDISETLCNQARSIASAHVFRANSLFTEIFRELAQKESA